MLRHEAKCDLRQLTCVHVDCSGHVCQERDGAIRGHMSIKARGLSHSHLRFQRESLQQVYPSSTNFVTQGDIKDLRRIIYFLLFVLIVNYVMYLILALRQFMPRDQKFISGYFFIKQIQNEVEIDYNRKLFAVIICPS